MRGAVSEHGRLARYHPAEEGAGDTSWCSAGARWCRVKVRWPVVYPGRAGGDTDAARSLLGVSKPCYYYRLLKLA